MCDMYDLFCNSSEKNEENGVSCKPVKTDLQYTINSEQCGNYFGTGYVGHQCYQANPTCLKTNVPTPEAQALQAPETLVADMCWLSDNACNMIFADGSKVVAAGACTGLSAATMEACKLFANKLDPLCQKETAIFVKACKASVTTAGAFGAGECKKLASNAIGCPKNDELATKELSYGFQLYSICPPAKYAAFNIHTMAQMEVDFKNTCAEVAGEIQARANGENGWVDPHNDGHYRLLSANSNLIETSRQTHRYKYTDDQAFAMTPNGSGCTVKMCSVSQGTSADSGGTDMCDMYDLFRNSSEKNTENGVSCKPVKTDLQYTINSEQCGNYFGEVYVGHQCQAANPTCLKTNTPTPEAQALQAPQTLVADLCWLSDNACNMIFADGSKVLAAGACTGLSAATMEACKLFANKLDPLCQKEAAIFEKACKASIITAGTFGAGECKKLADSAIGCPKTEELAAQETQLGFQLYSICPPAKYAAFNVHTMAQMEVDFQNSCAEVAGEIEARANGANGWVDPHNDGHYKLVSANSNLIETSRQTHYYKYTDDQAFSMTPNGSGGCTVKMCSVSQGTSADSGGTDMCDMYDLFCNSSEK